MTDKPQYRWSPSAGKMVEVVHLNPEAPSQRPRRQWKRRFVQVPYEWVGRLRQAKHGGTFKLALWLLYEWWHNGGQPVVVSNIKTRQEAKLPPRSKSKALAELQTLDLIEVERYVRRSPRVTLKHTGRRS